MLQPRAILLCLVLAQPAMADTAADRFAPKRGLNFDIWNTWLSVEDMVTTPGFLDIYPDWRAIVPPKAIAGLSAMGFDFVRLPMDPAPLLRLGPGPAQDALIDQIAETALMVQAAGLKTIVDLHSIPRPDEAWGTDSVVGDTALFAAYIALTANVAARLNGMDPDRTALELLNEPTSDCDSVWSGGPMTWPDQLIRLHRAARKAAPDLPLVLSGACWGGVDGLKAIDPAAIADNNVLWSFHSYEPFLFTHQGASWTTGLNALFTGITYPPTTIDDATAARLLSQAEGRLGTSTNKDATPAALAQALQNYRDRPPDDVGTEIRAAAVWADQHGIPRGRLILGEFGAIRDDMTGSRLTGTGRAAFLKDKRTAAEALGIGWAVWGWTGAFGITDDDTTRAIAPDICVALGLLQC